MSARWLILALLLVPLLLFGGRLWRETAGADRLFPGLESGEVARIEIARGREQVVIARRLDTGDWVLSSAADAPGDGARIAAALAQLERLRGQPLPADAPVQRREPLQIRLSDRAGETLGHAAFWTGEARALPDGPRLAIERAPALPLWPSAWSSLAPPRIRAAQVASVERLTPEGPEPLPTAAAAEVGRMLEQLTARDFVAGAGISWAGARLLRVQMADGTAIDLQQVPDGDGRFHLRLTSDDRTDVRQARHFAFRVEKPLP